MEETGDELAATEAPSPSDDPLPAPRLSAGQLALLRRYGEVQSTEAGQELFRGGTAATTAGTSSGSPPATTSPPGP